MAKKPKKDYIFAVGRRKSAIARIRLFKGNNENTVNGDLIGKYFPGKVATLAWQKPFELTGLLGKYYFTAKILGGGKEGQIDALAHGVSRAISLIDPKKHRAPLKTAGLLTRDAREKERRMVGTGGKSRKQKQSPKR